MPIIQTVNLVKHYGAIEALNELNLSVEKGEIFGLLGQNGAGKTTLIKILLGVIKATSGQASLLGEPAGRASVRRRVGYLPEDHRFPDYHTGYSLLDFYGMLLGVPHRALKERIPAALELVGLTRRMHYKIRTYSKGMKQRIGVAQAILHDPDVIFLDEPTDGVDPVGRKEIRKILQQLKAEGKTIFLNSHLLSEVELVCDRIGILQSGKLIRQGDIQTLTSRQGLFEVGLAPEQLFPAKELSALGYQVRANEDLWEVELVRGQTIDPVVDMLRARGLSIRHLMEKRQTLEELFMETVMAAEPGVDFHASAANRRLESRQDR